ncbi:MAG: DUF2303 family protein [Rhodocyclaceae bacterium]|nr:DUF2303 family protein [Rhodocyclaceae bacterium]MCA3116383.1 DUF2303 family protein [Rhodocyclaceae bacterium]
MDNPALNNRDDAPAVVEAAELGRRIAAATATPRRGSYQDAGEFIILRNADGSERVEWIQKVAPWPERKTGTVPVNDIDSFIFYWKQHVEDGHIYAQMSPAKFVGVLNDHQPNGVEGPIADRRDHRVIYEVKHSTEWSTWEKISCQRFESNEQLARFIERNMPDFVEPSGARMAEIALNFLLKADVEFTSVQRLQDGNIQLGYTNNVNASAGGAAIPEMCRIRIPVFEGINATLYDIETRFRYRKAGDKVVFWFELVRPHKVLELAFRDLWEHVGKQTSEHIILGRPE